MTEPPIPSPPIRQVNLCGFCGPNITHVIDPATHYNDRFAKPIRTTHGLLWKCGNCISKNTMTQFSEVHLIAHLQETFLQSADER